TPQDANEVHAGIREKVADMYSRDIAESLCIQYGGSVKPNNVRELMAMEHIDGALVGGASLSVKDFTSIVLFDRD
ncbi:MAG: triose-phosphate isomerase, partial [Spirochaetaceae bacterium]